MATQEIDSNDWEQLFERFTQLHQGTPITIEHVHGDGTSHEIARGLPLDRIQFSKTDGCSDMLQINLGHGTGQRGNHTVVEPIRILLRQHSVGPKTLQIDAESGTTMITFASGKVKELMDGLHVLEGKNMEPVEFHS
ncbi:MAG TPA: DUF5335 family protein [Methylomirabilota bacterium]|nr:DUF5335 family protein [Methylomirabilota bacterium]